MSRSPRSLRFARLLLASAPVLVSLQACGRSEPGDYLFDEDAGKSGSATGGNGAVGGSGVAGTGPGKGGTTGTGGSVIGGSTGTGGTTIGGGAGGKSSGGATGVGGTGGAVTGGVAGVAGTGAAGEPNVPDVTCGNDTCDSASESCCVSLGGFACVRKNQACNGAVLDCTSAADCSGGDVCCLAFASASGSASTCKDRCAGMSQDIERQLCRTDDECVGNRRCTSTVFGVSVCTRRP